MNINELISSGKSIKSFRGALCEASRSFAPGALSDIVFKFYKELKAYYGDLLINQFQLYSDRPTYILGITDIKVVMGNDVKFFSFGTGKNKDFSDLQDLNETPFEKVTSISYYFELAPDITNLVRSTQMNTNKTLFTKKKDLSVAKGDGTYVVASFIPQWNEKGVKLTCAGLSQDNTTTATMFYTTGGI